MEFKVNEKYMITGTDLGMMTVIETGKDIEEIIERVVTRGPIPDVEKQLAEKDKEIERLKKDLEAHRDNDLYENGPL